MSRFSFGFIFTVVWFSFIAWFVYSHEINIFSLSLNEYGDFLAGAVAPIAFLWLILGYMQHGQELKENTNAIVEQKNEYSKSVKIAAYTALVEFENNEVKLLNGLGEQFKEGAKNARERANKHKVKIEKLLNEIE